MVRDNNPLSQVDRPLSPSNHNKPVIVGEQGNHVDTRNRPLGVGGVWDDRSALRMRIRNWTALFNEIAFIFWNTSYARDGHNMNIWLGPKEREYVRAMQDFAYRLDKDVRIVPVTVSDPHAVRAYALASQERAGVYLHHFADHTNPVKGLKVILEAPKAAKAYWYSPENAEILGSVNTQKGTNTLEVPQFVVDLALLVTADGPPDIDKGGNSADSPVVTVSVDKTAPVISNIKAEQGAGSSVLCPNIAVQGVVDIYVDVVDSGCSPLVVPPTVNVAGIGAAAYQGVSGDTYHYQVTVAASTANGAHTITVSAQDALGNSSSDSSQSICVNKNQVTGTVELDRLNPPTGGITRTVTFVANGGTKTWNISVSFAAGSSTGSYTLTDVPAGTTALSAKAAWNLRRKLTGLLPDVNGQLTGVNFTGGNKLLGGDINESNGINILDYSILKTNWFTTNAVADINGDGMVNLLDYSIMQSNFFQKGDDL